MDSTLLPNDLDKLPKGERTLFWPPGYPNYKSFLLEGLWSLALYKDLRQLRVVRDKHAIMTPQVLV